MKRPLVINAATVRGAGGEKDGRVEVIFYDGDYRKLAKLDLDPKTAAKLVYELGQLDLPHLEPWEVL